MKYQVPSEPFAAGTRTLQRPKYFALLGRGAVTQGPDGTFVVEVNTGAPDFAPCEAPGHAELLTKPDVVLIE